MLHIHSFIHSFIYLCFKQDTKCFLCMISFYLYMFLTDIGEWELAKVIGTESGFFQRGGRLEFPVEVAVTADGGVAVMDLLAKQCKIYNREYKHTHSIKTKQGGYTFPHDIVIDSQGNMYITDRKPFVQVYDMNYKLVAKWLTVKPGQSAGNEEPELCGIDMDDAGNLLVGCRTRPWYISKHRQDGSHVHSFNVSIRPWYLAVTPHDTIIISNGDSGSDGRVGIVSQTGETLHRVQYPDMSCPTGVHCHHNVIYVCDGNNTNISCLSVSGEYIGCIPTDTSKYGDGEDKGCDCVCVNEEGNKMYVSRGDGDSGRVEVYVRKT